jgi:hypothetical protein
MLPCAEYSRELVARRPAVKTSQFGIGLFRPLVIQFERRGGLNRFTKAVGKDVAAMAALFSENGVRITPAGIFQGRDAIRREMQRVIEKRVIEMGLHGYSARRTVSRLEGNMVFNAGEWQARLGDQQFHGYYSALLVREGDEVKNFGRDRQRCSAMTTVAHETASVGGRRYPSGKAA